jgi:hypothetical protein
LEKRDTRDIIPTILLEIISTRLVYLGSIPMIYGRRKNYTIIHGLMMMPYSTCMANREEGSKTKKKREKKTRRR